MNSKHHKKDATQVAIQLPVVTTREIYKRTQAHVLHIMIPTCLESMGKKQQHITCVRDRPFSLLPVNSSISW